MRCDLSAVEEYTQQLQICLILASKINKSEQVDFSSLLRKGFEPFQ